MKTIKKSIIIAALFILGTGLFAQEAEESKPAKEKPNLNLYFGAETGASMADVLGESLTGFELIPYVGIRPLAKYQDILFEFDLQMQFFTYTLDEKASSKLNWNVITPQFLFGNKYDIGSFKPFWKAGIGLNINSGKLSYATTSEKVEGTAAFCFVVNAGAELEVNEHFAISLNGRFSTNESKPTVAKYNFFDGTINMDTKSFSVGVKYKK